jgi:hypothetical protein
MAKRWCNARLATAMAGGEVGQEAKQPADVSSLPNELQLAVIREVAYQPNRVKEFANLRNTDTHTRALIDETADPGSQPASLALTGCGFGSDSARIL